ncbi:MAG: glycosyltransferase [Caulobacteraceae bacterium]
MLHNYYSVISRDYIYKCVLLYKSMLRHDKNFRFLIVCLHDEVKDTLEKLRMKNTELIDISQIEKYDTELAAIKNSRNTKQYAWAVKPAAALYILEHYREVSHIIWLDGDTAFLSSPEAIFEEWGKSSILLTEEKFTGKYEYLSSIYGYFNTGFMGFNRDDTAIKSLKYFRKRLLEWNYDKKEQYRWNDQLYVSDWKGRFDNVGVVKNPGINLTPFIFNRILEEEGGVLKTRDRDIYFNDYKIVLFHFYGFKCFNNKEFELCYYTDIYHKPEIDIIYVPYMKEALRAIREIAKTNKSRSLKYDEKYDYIRNHYRLSAS